MRICFIASTYPKHETDGSARFVRSVAESVADLGHEVHVLIPHRSDLDLRGNRVAMHTFKYAWSPSLEIMGYASAMNSDTKLRPRSYAMAPAFAASEAYTLLRLQQQHDFDVIHAHWIIPNGVIAAAIAKAIRCPLVVSLHGSDIFVAQKNAVLGKIAAAAFRQCAAVTACSPELEAGARVLGVDQTRLHLIPWGADPVIFGDITEARTATRTRLGLPPDQLVLLSLGRLVRKKGVMFLIQAMQRVLSVLPETLCLIAGDGPERAQLEALSRSLGIAANVRFLGRVAWTEVPGLLAACDTFVVPSIHDENGNVDGLPTTIPEAMAAGRPVISTRVAGVELAVRNGVDGLIVDEKNSGALAHAILLMLTQPQVRTRLGDNARIRVETELNWRSVGRQFVEIYRESLGHAQP